MPFSLEEEIESVRKQLIRSAEQEGLTSKETIELSKKLDFLLNKYSVALDAYTDQKLKPM
ncbi:aspartyl-phosphate phosphatase Spo0E family protein [Sporosarcina sp. Te-1]|uniref:aspartyl-phosphate phosphatase Spo0E family protein n=1 Tax=Sporosarcina sp. Te-1 TaxID=2818390 RepID=UPI002738B8B7|nr:aspartyl-phosphate phosphatase Spo0E family protein [Sporosarcina sp. Te-1]